MINYHLKNKEGDFHIPGEWFFICCLAPCGTNIRNRRFPIDWNGLTGIEEIHLKATQTPPKSILYTIYAVLHNINIQFSSNLVTDK